MQMHMQIRNTNQTIHSQADAIHMGPRESLGLVDDRHLVVLDSYSTAVLSVLSRSGGSLSLLGCNLINVDRYLLILRWDGGRISVARRLGRLVGSFGGL